MSSVAILLDGGFLRGPPASPPNNDLRPAAGIVNICVQFLHECIGEGPDACAFSAVVVHKSDVLKLETS